MLHRIAIAPLIVLVLHILVTILGWYEQFYWLDTPMHFLGGVSIGISSYYFVTFAELKTKFHPKLFLFVVILALTALAAVAWEVLEYNLDLAFHTVMQPSVRDTMKDLAFGLVGGAISAIIMIIKKPS